MRDEDLDRRKSLTFEQAEGAVPLPSQLALKEISPELRSRLYELVFGSMKFEYSTLQGSWRQVMYKHWVERQHRLADQFSTHKSEVIKQLRDILWNNDYVRIFGFIQWALRLPSSPLRASSVDAVLTACHAPYRIIQNTVVPIGSEAEAATLKRAFSDVNAGQLSGAHAHLQNAAEQLTQGNFPDSIRESIHAVEATARILEPPAKTLGDALRALESKVKIHSALQAGFLKIYGFTSDEKGIRHALLDKPDAAVDETDALFMIGACAAFVSYLINRGRQAGLIS